MNKILQLTPRVNESDPLVAEMFAKAQGNIKQMFNSTIYDLEMRLETEINTTISFENSLETRLAAAYYFEDRMVFNMNSLLNRSVKRTILHEQSHILCYQNNLCTGHRFEFLIFDACLSKKFANTKHNIFRAYDMSEELDLETYDTNIKEFDDLIKSITFNTLEELVDKVRDTAFEIRRQKTFAINQTFMQKLKKTLRIWGLL